jgi:hypothetical protein
MNRIVAACFVAVALAVGSRYGPRLVYQIAQQSQQNAPKAVRRTAALKQPQFGGTAGHPAGPARLPRK